MPLLDFWLSAPEAVGKLTVEQVVASAGDGYLKDGSVCSKELRHYLSQIPSTAIAAYIDHCLAKSFPKGGMVLQDLVNELGRRLDYGVENGLYQGVSNQIGFDGLWLSPEGHTIISEVKTTDSFRISLDTLNNYKIKLSNIGKISSSSSILIVVGREDTGELEAQIRGSRYAWDIRVISADSLVKLVHLKENADGGDTGQKIRSLLTPMEYTRLDRVIDVVFTTAKDVENAAVSETLDDDAVEEPALTAQKTKGAWTFTDSGHLQTTREKIVSVFGRKQGTTFVKNSRALFWDATHERRLACAISKRYSDKSSYPYWYAYRPQVDQFLKGGNSSHFVLGGMDLNCAFAIPWDTMRSSLDALNTTTTKDGVTYWHVRVTEPGPNTYALLLPKKGSVLNLDHYRFALDA